MVERLPNHTDGGPRRGRVTELRSGRLPRRRLYIYAPASSPHAGRLPASPQAAAAAALLAASPAGLPDRDQCDGGILARPGRGPQRSTYDASGLAGAGRVVRRPVFGFPVGPEGGDSQQALALPAQPLE